MYKKYIVFLIFLAQFSLSFGQDSFGQEFDIENLETQYKQEKNDTLKLEVLDKICRSYLQQKNFDQVIIKADTMVAMAQKIKLLDYVTRALDYKVSGYIKTKAYEKAIETYKLTISYLEDLKDTNTFYKNYVAIADIFASLKSSDSAKFYYQKASIILKKTDQVDVNNALLNNKLGKLAFTEKQHKKALTYYRKAFESAELLDDQMILVATYLNLSAVYYELSKYKLSIENAHTALNLSKKNKYNEEIVLSRIRIAKVNTKLKININESIEALESSMNYIKTNEDDAILFDLYLTLGNCLEVKKNYKEAIKNYRKAIYISKRYAAAIDSIYEVKLALARILSKTNNQNNLSEALNYAKEIMGNQATKKLLREDLRTALDILFKAEKKGGNYKNALNYLERLTVLNDTLNAFDIKLAVDRVKNSQLKKDNEKDSIIFNLKNQLKDLKERASIRQKEDSILKIHRGEKTVLGIGVKNSGNKSGSSVKYIILIILLGGLIFGLFKYRKRLETYVTELLEKLKEIDFSTIFQKKEQDNENNNDS